MFPSGAFCKGRGFNCGSCNKKNSCEQFIQPSFNIEDIPIISLETELQNIYNYGKAFVDACEYAEITDKQGLKFLEKFSQFKRL